MSAASLKAIATGQQPAEPKDPFSVLKSQLEKGKHEFLSLLGNNPENVDKFIRVVLNSVMSTPDLLDADRRSLINAAMKAAQDGLMPDGREAVLNIYNTKTVVNGKDVWTKRAQYLPMVGGLVKKLYESKQITYLDAACVFANDKFTYRRGDDAKIEHEPTLSNEPGEIVAAYVVVKLTNGETKREVMPRRDIDAVRNASNSKDSGPWKKWFDQQAIKSVIKRVYKQLPKADAFERIAESDNHASGYGSDSSVSDIAGFSSIPQIENTPSGEPFPTQAQPKERELVPIGSFASLEERLTKCTDDGMGAIILEEAKHLPEDQQSDLAKLYKSKFQAA